MPRRVLIVSTFKCLVVLWVALSATAQQPGQGPAGQAPARQGTMPNVTRNQRPPLFFREDWKPMSSPKGNGEHTINQQDLENPNLELKLYGDKNGPQEVYQANDDVTIVWTGLCTVNCAVALRDKNNYVDLTGFGKIGWRTMQAGFHLLRPVVKLADGTWLVGDHTDGYSSDWVVSEISLADVRWRRLDIEKVAEARDGKWVDNPDLSKVDEIGFTDLMAGSGHGPGGSSRVDWIEVYGKPVSRAVGASSQ
jgi:hypothetical protein